MKTLYSFLVSLFVVCLASAQSPEFRAMQFKPSVDAVVKNLAAHGVITEPDNIKHSYGVTQEDKYTGTCYQVDRMLRKVYEGSFEMVFFNDGRINIRLSYDAEHVTEYITTAPEPGAPPVSPAHLP
jgi:hypothetical protein